MIIGWNFCQAAYDLCIVIRLFDVHNLTPRNNIDGDSFEMQKMVLCEGIRRREKDNALVSTFVNGKVQHFWHF